ncbi:MAG: lytic transglycosylase domain-containing protein [Candidatus Margulisiibacteriota bacterium]
MSIFSTGGQKEDAVAYRENIPDAWEHVKEGTKTLRAKDSETNAECVTRNAELSECVIEIQNSNPDTQYSGNPGLSTKNYQLKTELSPKARIIYQHITSTRKSVPDYEAELIANTIVHYSEENKVDPFLAAALIERESGFNARAISKHGAKGLGQLMDFNLKALKINDPFNIEEAVRGTVTYLSYLMNRWQNKTDKISLTLASYLEGPNGIARNNCRWKQSTGKYISDILKTYDKLKLSS